MSGISNVPEGNQSEEVKEVISKIEKFGRPDGIFSDTETQTIDSLYKKVKTSEGKKEVKDYVKKHFTGESTNKLSDLLSDIEISVNGYGMDVLVKNSTSKFFNIILSNKAAVEWYDKYFIASKIEGNKDLFPNGYETLNLIYWKKITDEVGLKSAGSFAMDKVGGFFAGLVGKITNLGEKAGSGNMDLSKIGSLVEELQSIGETDEKSITDEQKEKILGVMGKLIGYIDSMTKGYSKNLNTLIELGESDKEGLKKLLDNPVILSEVLETGKTSKEGYNIDLQSKEVSFASNPDLEKSKKEFMSTVIESTNKSGKTLDKLKGQTKQLAGLLTKFGLDGATLRDFRDSLKEIPFIGEFLYALVGFFLSDKLLNLMDGNLWKKEFESSGKALQSFISSNKDKKTPFKVEEKEFEDESNTKAVEIFLGKVNNADEKNFNARELDRENKEKGEGKTDFKKGKISPLINSSKFWEAIFSDKESDNPILEQIRLKSQELKSKELSSKDFFKEISKMKVNIVPAKEPLSEAEKELKAMDKIESKKLVLSDRDELKGKIEKIGDMPYKVTLESKKELNIGFEDGKLQLNLKEFVLDDGKISSISFEGDNAKLKLQNKEGVEIEKILTKKQFAGIIVGLAIGEYKSIEGLVFISLKEKENLVINSKESKTNAEKTKLETEKTALKVRIDLLTKEITKLEGNIKKFDNIILPLESDLGIKQLELSELNTKRDLNEVTISENNDKIIILKDKLEDNSFYERVGVFFGVSNDDIDLKMLNRSVRDLTRTNSRIDKKRLNLKSEIGSLITKIDISKKGKGIKEGELNTQKLELKISNDRLIKIGEELDKKDIEAEALNEQIIQKEKKLNKDVKLAKIKLEDKRAILESKIAAEKNFKDSIYNISKLPATINYNGENLNLNIVNNNITLGSGEYKISVIYNKNQAKLGGLDIGPAKGDELFDSLSFEPTKGVIITANGEENIIDKNQLVETIKSLLSTSTFEKNIEDKVTLKITQVS